MHFRGSHISIQNLLKEMQEMCQQPQQNHTYKTAKLLEGGVYVLHTLRFSRNLNVRVPKK